MNTQPRFISLEGGDGCGKTTQARLLFKALWEADVQSMPTHEPGGTVGADTIRALLVDGRAERWHPVTEMLLHNAARSDHVERCIKPALAAGEWVICDRYVDSTYAYQGYGQGVDIALIAELHKLAIGDFMPELTLLFDMETEEALERAKSRKDLKNRYENMNVAFHKRLREGYRELARQHPERIRVINAAGSMEEVHHAVVAAVNQRFNLAIPALPERLVYDF